MRSDGEGTVGGDGDREVMETEGTVGGDGKE